MTTVFRPYPSSDALRSDRSAGDRLRHRKKVRKAIRENIADIVAEESVIGQDGDRIVKVPIRGIREYRFIYGDNNPGVGSSGDGDVEEGQVIGRKPGEGDAPGEAGDRPGVDYYETDITLDELIDIMFEDLELPDLAKKAMRQTPVARGTKRQGYRRTGIRVHLDKRRSAKNRLRRKIARHGSLTESATAPDGSEKRFPFNPDDLRYRRRVPDEEMESNAVVICIMDTSGSMETMKKYLARSFFFLLYQFVRTRYRNVELVFIAHHSEAREVTEEEFFHKGESGGTLISSGYNKALEVIRERYHPDLWNVYAFHCSDGDNFTHDNDVALAAAAELCDVCNLFGYGEIKPMESYYRGDSMLDLFGQLNADNFQTVLIEKKEDVWPGFRALLDRDRAAAAAAPTDGEVEDG
jgi:sporulation protein YhbH